MGGCISWSSDRYNNSREPFFKNTCIFSICILAKGICWFILISYVSDVAELCPVEVAHRDPSLSAARIYNSQVACYLNGFHMYFPYACMFFDIISLTLHTLCRICMKIGLSTKLEMTVVVTSLLSRGPPWRLGLLARVIKAFVALMFAVDSFVSSGHWSSAGTLSFYTPKHTTLEEFSCSRLCDSQ